MINVYLYTNSKQDESRSILDQLESLQSVVPHRVSVIDIQQDSAVYQGYFGKTPVVEVGNYRLLAPFTEIDLQVTLKSAMDRQAKLTASDPAYAKRLENAGKLTGGDRLGIWITRHYMAVINIFLVVYLGLPFSAPVFQKLGWNQPAQVIHAIYSPLCHQLAYRSWFLFGEQAVYPRELAGIQGLATYEQATGLDSRDILTAKAYTGDDVLGYKVAYCERDVAIYGGMLMFSLFFTLSGRKIKAIPWYVWFIGGLVPIGLDGVSQLPALLSFDLAWLPVRESTPVLRTISGLLFGVTTAWYGLPLFEETMRESRHILNKKFALQVGNRQ